MWIVHFDKDEGAGGHLYGSIIMAHLPETLSCLFISICEPIFELPWGKGSSMGF